MPTHRVIVPSYDTGPVLARTLRDARAAWPDVLLVLDGGRPVDDVPPGVAVLRRPRRGGKGAAVLTGLQDSAALGYTHALVMDADGQHPPDRIGAFMAASLAAPDALVAGAPVFDVSAPRIRLLGRRVCNALVDLETGGRVIADSLFGFRVYPIAPLLAEMADGSRMRGFDFDPEAAVRLIWRGHPCRNLPAPVRYLTAREGGVSHFRYCRHNLLLARMHARLLAGAWRGRARSSAATPAANQGSAGAAAPPPPGTSSRPPAG